MRRVFILVLDSLGVGSLPDAARFGDEGAHTLDHLVEAAGGLAAPELIAAGLGAIEGVHSLERGTPRGAFGRMAERSPGKDTPTGHWEMMGCALDTAFPVFPEGFDLELLAEWCRRAGLEGWLENGPASGTEVIERRGAEHLATGFPIVYTSADSVLQVAAHEEHFGLERLLEVCEVARELTRPLGLGRVIARPFVGEVGSFQRTYNRRDYSLPPPRETVLDRLKAAGHAVVGVGKIEDIFAGRGLTRAIHSEGNSDGMRVTSELADELEAGLVFVNLVDFDSSFGHRRDPEGYRAALETFDRELADLLPKLRDDDLLLMTADHGTDPTWPGNDHTREYVPLLALGAQVRAGVDVG
ncbi:MAG: phosphopentomutase, partial [Planctomycetota bacterium]|nr:phosphopentomutase [Planctomycetota bacterium]